MTNYLRFFLRKISEVLVGNSVSYILLRPIRKHRLKILCYHRVINRADFDKIRTKGIYVEVSKFERQMKYLQKHYAPVSELEVISSVLYGKKLSPNAVWVTFDDGFKDNYTNAFPILKMYNIPATIFLTTGFVNGKTVSCADYIALAMEKTTKMHINHPELGMMKIQTPAQKKTVRDKLWLLVRNRFRQKYLGRQRDYLTELISMFGVPIEGNFDDLFLSWEQASEMSQNGIHFGGHTVNHEILAALDANEIAEEIFKSNREIEERLKIKIKTFAYPRGKRMHYNSACKKILRDNGVFLAVTTEFGSNSINDKLNQYELNRWSILATDNMLAFKMKLIV